MTERHFFELVGRRCLSVPMYFLLAILSTATLPLTGLFMICWDLAKRNNWAFCRSMAFWLVYLYCECAGLLVGLGIWIFSGRFLGLNKETFIRWAYWLQRWWGHNLCRGAFRIFGIHMNIDGFEDVGNGPLILFLRHVALPDTSLPGMLFVVGRKMHIRHIIKRELLWDPCLDIGGNWLPNFFVRRGLADNRRELHGIGRLMENLEKNEGVMIYPEGTRFTPKKRQHIIDRLAQKGDEYFLEKARQLKNVLPPRLGGSMALLEKNINACAVFCAHVGFEATTKMWDFLNGSMINKTILVKLWKVPFEEIPKTYEERIEWLYEHWAKIDAWIEQHKNPALPLPESNFRP